MPVDRVEVESKVPPANGVPDQLVDELHDANERLHHSKEHLEQAIDGCEYRHQERVNQATDQFRKAEHEVEEVTEKIKDSLREQPAA